MRYTYSNIRDAKSSEMAALFIFLLLLVSAKAEIDNKNLDNRPYPNSPLAKEDLVETVKVVMLTMMDYVKPLVAQAVEEKLQSMGVHRQEIKVGKLLQKDEEIAECFKNSQEEFSNMAHEIKQEIKVMREEQTKLGKRFNSLELKMEEKVVSITNYVNGITYTLLQKSSQDMDKYLQVTNSELSTLNNKMKHLETVNNQLQTMEEETKMSHDRIIQAIQNITKITENEVGSKIEDVFRQLPCTQTSTYEAVQENQQKLSVAVNSIANDVKDVIEDLCQLINDANNTKTVIKASETAMIKEMWEVNRNLTTYLMEARLESGTILGLIPSKNDLSSFGNEIKELIQELVPGLLNCAEILQSGRRASGIYNVTVSSVRIQVYCDMTSDGGGWTVIQRRDDVTPHIDFFRYWSDYKQGFGDLNKEFWLGLDAMHLLTHRQDMSLKIDLEDWEGTKKFAYYERFDIGDEAENYRLSIGGYSGDAGDALKNHNGQGFSTRDVENDRHQTANCAMNHEGAWWFNSCHHSNLNGEYLGGKHKSYADGIIWSEWKGIYYSLKRATMKIRPKNFKTSI